MNNLIMIAILYFAYLSLVGTFKIKICPKHLLRTVDYITLDVIFQTFSLELDHVIPIVRMLRYPWYDFNQHYVQYTETLARFDGLKKLSIFEELHPALFPTTKLLTNPLIAALFFPHGQPYFGNLLIPYREPDGEWQLDKETLLSMFVHAGRNLSKMECSKFLETFFENIDSERTAVLFDSLRGHMTPFLFTIFMMHSSPAVLLPLADSYIQESMNDNVESCLRFMIVSRTTLMPGQPIGDLSPITCSALLKSPVHPSKVKVSVELLQGMLQVGPSRNDFSFWETFAVFLVVMLRKPNVNEVAVSQIATEFLNVVPSRALCPMTATWLFTAISESYPSLNGIIKKKFETRFWPPMQLSLLDRLALWMRDGPLMVDGVRSLYCTVDEFLDMLSWSLRKFPINNVGYFEGDGSRRLQDIHIEHARAYIRSGRECYTNKRVLLITAWIYLLAEGQKLNFGKFFTEFQNAQDWSKVRICGSLLEPQVLHALETWSISVFFTPMELRQLVDFDFVTP
ncbi:hypothetical protein PSACC_00748 [Paramicrosporidium saccamoebae]|uniref:Uncharacterized protein n=1 Tax=Paramicrosporidium saccamoebae TaxID=1246581 RepID=A0A2H9TNY4_9FUNG|nr:hypothetical protein PSACC_00748 [Paramicrosporidium saccamoebae]